MSSCTSILNLSECHSIHRLQSSTVEQILPRKVVGVRESHARRWALMRARRAPEGLKVPLAISSLLYLCFLTRHVLLASSESLCSRKTEPLLPRAFSTSKLWTVCPRLPVVMAARHLKRLPRSSSVHPRYVNDVPLPRSQNSGRQQERWKRNMIFCLNCPCSANEYELWNQSGIYTARKTASIHRCSHDRSSRHRR